jgi:hypothetical protein
MRVTSSDPKTAVRIRVTTVRTTKMWRAWQVVALRLRGEGDRGSSVLGFSGDTDRRVMVEFLA